MANWGALLGSLGQGLMAAGSPQGWSAFGPAFAQGQQMYDQRSQAAQLQKLREMQLKQSQQELDQDALANTEAAAAKKKFQDWLSSPEGQGFLSQRSLPPGLMDALPFGEVAGAVSQEAFAKPDPLKAPPTRERDVNGMTIQEEMAPDGTWNQIGSRPTFAPKQQQDMSIDFNGDGTPDFVMGSGALKLTEAQSKDTGWATRLEGAVGDMAAAEQGGYDPTAGASAVDYIGQKSVGGLIGNAITSDSGKRWYRGAKEALAVILRKDSGGAITPNEFAMYGPIYIPMPWDDPATKQSKQQAINTMLGALKTTSGGGYDANKARTDAAAPPPAPVPTAGPQGAASKPGTVTRDGYTIEPVN